MHFTQIQNNLRDLFHFFVLVFTYFERKDFIIAINTTLSKEDILLRFWVLVTVGLERLWGNVLIVCE